MPTRRAFSNALQLVKASATAFEMYHALVALDRLVPYLAADEKEKASEVLRAEARDPRGVGIEPGSDRLSLIERLLELSRPAEAPG